MYYVMVESCVYFACKDKKGANEITLSKYIFQKNIKSK